MFEMILMFAWRKKLRKKAQEQVQKKDWRGFWIFHFIIGLFTFSLYCSAKATTKREPFDDHDTIFDEGFIDDNSQTILLLF